MAKSKKGLGKFIAFATIAGAVAAGISYFTKYKSFHKELEEDFHDFEDNDNADQSTPVDSTMNRNYVSLTPDKEVLDAAKETVDTVKEAASQTADNITAAAKDTVDTVKDAAADMGSTVHDMTETVKESAESVMDTAKDTIDDLKDASTTIIEDSAET